MRSAPTDSILLRCSPADFTLLRCSPTYFTDLHRLSGCVVSPTEFTEFTEVWCKKSHRFHSAEMFSHRFHRFTQIVWARSVSHRIHRIHRSMVQKNPTDFTLLRCSPTDFTDLHRLSGCVVFPTEFTEFTDVWCKKNPTDFTEHAEVLA